MPSNCNGLASKVRVNEASIISVARSTHDVKKDNTNCKANGITLTMLKKVSPLSTLFSLEAKYSFDQWP